MIQCLLVLGVSGVVDNVVGRDVVASPCMSTPLYKISVLLFGSMEVCRLKQRRWSGSLLCRISVSEKGIKFSVVMMPLL
mgnify:CR=1 FL=1